MHHRTIRKNYYIKTIHNTGISFKPSIHRGHNQLFKYDKLLNKFDLICTVKWQSCEFEKVPPFFFYLKLFPNIKSRGDPWKFFDPLLFYLIFVNFQDLSLGQKFSWIAVQFIVLVESLCTTDEFFYIFRRFWIG